MSRVLTGEQIEMALGRIQERSQVEPQFLYACTVRDVLQLRAVYPHAVISMPARVYRELTGREETLPGIAAWLASKTDEVASNARWLRWRLLRWWAWELSEYGRVVLLSRGERPRRRLRRPGAARRKEQDLCPHGRREGGVLCRLCEMAKRPADAEEDREP